MCSAFSHEPGCSSPLISRGNDVFIAHRKQDLGSGGLELAKGYEL